MRAVAAFDVFAVDRKSNRVPMAIERGKFAFQSFPDFLDAGSFKRPPVKLGGVRSLAQGCKQSEVKAIHSRSKSINVPQSAMPVAFASLAFVPKTIWQGECCHIVIPHFALFASTCSGVGGSFGSCFCTANSDVISIIR